MKKKILITGGAGFIGSHIQDRLVDEGHEVLVLDNLRSGNIDNLNPKSEFYQADICDGAKVDMIFNKFRPSVVFHLAAQNEVPYSMKHPFEDQILNVAGTMNILEACQKFGIKKIVYSNTGGAFYGTVNDVDLPIKEDQLVLKPTSFYGVSKLAAEAYIKLYGNIYGLEWVSLRYSNVYGPRQLGNKEAGVVAIFMEQLLNGKTPRINGKGNHTRDYVYVADVVEANIKAMHYPQSDYFNISTSVETTTKQVYDIIKKGLKTMVKPEFGPSRPGDPLRNCLDNSKARKKLSWKPKVDFKSGVAQTINYYTNLLD